MCTSWHQSAHSTCLEYNAILQNKYACKEFASTRGMMSRYVGADIVSRCGNLQYSRCLNMSHRWCVVALHDFTVYESLEQDQNPWFGDVPMCPRQPGFRAESSSNAWRFYYSTKPWRLFKFGKTKMRHVVGHSVRWVENQVIANTQNNTDLSVLIHSIFAYAWQNSAGSSACIAATFNVIGATWHNNDKASVPIFQKRLVFWNYTLSRAMRVSPMCCCPSSSFLAIGVSICSIDIVAFPQ